MNMATINMQAQLFLHARFQIRPCCADDGLSLHGMLQ